MKKIFLIENHHQAYLIWKKLKLKKITLFHFDAHHDCEINYLSIKKEKYIQINNFISNALNNNIINTFYWIIPGFFEEFQSNYLRLIQLVFRIKQNDYTGHDKIIVGRNYIETRVLRKSFIITTIDQLPKINKRILLDIDLDYFFIKSLYTDKATDRIGLRKQWISLSNFISYLYKISSQVDYVTISYSVNGGWTPAKFKHIGNLLAKKFGYNDIKNESYIQAGRLFYKFRENFEKNNFSKAKRYYKAALNLNHSYFISDNNYGRLYLIKGDFAKAETEFNNMLKIAKNYYYSYIGLGIIYLMKKNFKKALVKINEGLKINKDNLILLALKALTYKYLKDYTRSKEIIDKINYLCKKDEVRMMFNKLFGFENLENIPKKFNIINLIDRLKNFILLDQIIAYDFNF